MGRPTVDNRCGCKLKPRVLIIGSPEAPVSSEFLSLLRISEFFGFQWQNLTEILRLLLKVLRSENKAVIMITGPLYNICLQQM